ncbi:PspC domain-containing protein [Halanaerobium praevalens]|uniref:Phage shock protein C, PspC n=1 Tax=Halanaerobium praevalens (strain ATCC 33744 / DSM 2228 / GSL) TaxID=572479 RepID=E3DS60_HALPG|nr:PspC domain-containing protein [Halanaerobium praevalens]ADO78208.1 phage shock protein C, PspC [Halanaerobium praevalens DSM 2228]
MKKLYRSRENKKIAGVCGGLAEYFDLDPNLIRIGVFLLVLMSGIGILAYVAAWAIIPERPTHIDVDYDIDSDSAAEDQKQSSNEDKY